ncbi:MAG: 16S rRNA (guanine(966)-N(2))-methyltransferase RsmD [Lachnospiraceae bacterium]|nr:16S rRNA (guanine(966)-N(2))-methyltransferase RsmD [Lachnospiraceae bacterium]
MRVIAGSARRLQLKTVEGIGTRPTTDRIKETLFNMLQNDIEDCSFLDLFSGSGAIGIEALSRGAEYAVFVENNKNAVKCIKDNLMFTKLSDKARVIENSVLSAINILNGNRVFDVVFMDPPYNKNIEKEILEKLIKSNIIDNKSLIISEASLDTDFSYVSDMGYEVIKEKLYKTNKHIFLKKKI